MARFYKTASANPLDYMSRLNIPLMERVLATNEDYITQNLGQAAKLGELASTFPFLQPDEQRAKEITEAYSKQVDTITDAIRSDPANWRKQIDPIRNLSRSLQEDYKVGEISKIADNYSRYKKTSDYIDEQVKQYNKDGKGISADRAKAYKQHFLQSFIQANPKGTAYDRKTGEYNSINVFDPMNNIDIRKTLSEELDKMKADGEIRITDDVTGSGEYFNKVTQKWEGITPEKILRIATDRLNNPQLMDYLKQDSMVGVINGVFESDPTSPDYGKFITPYSYDKTGFTTAEQAIVNDMKKKIAATKNASTKEHLQSQLDAYVGQISNRTQLNWNDKSFLAPILRGITDQYSYQKTEQGNDLSNNSLFNTRLIQSETTARNNANIAARERMQQKGFDHAWDMQERRLESQKELKLLDIANKPPGKGGIKTTGEKKNTDNAVIGMLHTNPFYWQTENKDKMTTSLNDEIMLNQHSVEQLEKAYANLSKTAPENKVMLANAQNQITAAKAKLSSLQSQRDAALGYAINEWKAEKNPKHRYSDLNEQLVRSYLSGSAKSEFDKANAEFKKVEAARANMDRDSPEYNNFMANVYNPARKRKAETEVKYTSGQTIFNSQVKSRADDKLEKAAKETMNRNEIVNTTPTQDYRIIEMITANPSAYKIIDSNGKETNLSFEHGTANPNSIKINGAAVTTGIGNKNVELVATVNGKNYIISPKDDGNLMNSFLSEEFKKSKDKNVNNVGRILGSPTASVISDMMTEMRMNTNPAYGSKDAWVYKVIPNPANPMETMRIRARSISTGASEPKWEFQVETTNPSLIMKNAGKGNGYETDGKTMKGFVPLPSSKSPNGVYHNLEDVLSIFPSDQ